MSASDLVERLRAAWRGPGTMLYLSDGWDAAELKVLDNYGWVESRLVFYDDDDEEHRIDPESYDPETETYMHPDTGEPLPGRFVRRSWWTSKKFDNLRQGVRGKAGISPGLWKHWKGGHYYVIGTAHQADAPEALVVVYADSEGTLWTRPYEEFTGFAKNSGKKVVPRFVRADAG